MIPEIHTCPNNFPLIVVIIMFFAIAYIVMSITPPLVFAIWIDHNQTSKSISYSFTGMILVTHIANGIIRISYHDYCNTHHCIAAWLSEENIESELTEDIESSMKVYQNTNEFVSAMEKKKYFNHGLFFNG